MDLKQLTYSVKELARETGRYILQRQDEIKSLAIEKKGVHDFVTDVDKQAEAHLVKELKKLIPDSGFIAEEKTETKISDQYNWIVDPLDGTTNFIHGLRPTAVSVALQFKKQTVLGVVYEIGADEAFYAFESGGAFLNNEKIQVTQTDKIADSLLATGFPFHDYQRLDEFMETLTYFMRNSHGLRRLGSAATDLVYVACGRFDGFYEYSLSPWDVAAGAFIVEQAGGKVSDFTGGDNWLFGREIIAANSRVFDEFLQIVKQIMYGK